MKVLRVDIIALDETVFPPEALCVFTDAYGKLWHIREKEAVVRTEAMPPGQGVVAGEIKGRNNGIVCFDTLTPWGVEAVDGTTVFQVSEDMLVDVGADSL